MMLQYRCHYIEYVTNPISCILRDLYVRYSWLILINIFVAFGVNSMIILSLCCLS